MYKKLILLLALILIGISVAWANMRFDHQAHVEQYAFGMDCSTCHVEGATSIIPDVETCLMCHDESYAEMTDLGSINSHGPMWARNHGSMAKGAAMDCNACHSQSYCMECHVSGFADEQGSFSNHMMNSHSSDFHITHPLMARGNQQTCASCHEPQFCTDCHTGFQARIGRANSPSHIRTFNLGLNGDIDAIHAGMDVSLVGSCDSCHLQSSVAPNFHDWSIDHAREARRNLATCQSCHPGGDTCLNCHSAKGGVVGFNPHGKGWSDRKGRLDNASGGKTCRMCH